MIQGIIGKRKRDEDVISAPSALPDLDISAHLFDNFDTPALEQFNDAGLSSEGSVAPSESSDFKRSRVEKTKASKPKIPMGDIRREYGFLWSRAMNTCDKDILGMCLDKYCTADVTCSYKYVGVRFPYGCEDINIVGKEALLKFWEIIILSAPDGVFQIQENKFRVLSNGACANISKYVYNCTKIFWMSIDEAEKTVLYKKDGDSSKKEVSSFFEQDEANILSASVPKTPLNANVTPASVMGKKPGLSAYRYSAQQHAVPNFSTQKIQVPSEDFGLGGSLETPVRLIFIGTMTLFINPEGRVYKFEFMHSLKPE